MESSPHSGRYEAAATPVRSTRRARPTWTTSARSRARRRLTLGSTAEPNRITIGLRPGIRAITGLLCAVFVLTAYDGQQSDVSDERWGPLAVASPYRGAGQALFVGVLRVTEECVFLEQGNERTLLVWESDRTSWSPETRTISFDAQGGTVTVSDRDHVRLGGGGSAVDEGGLAPDEWVESIDWVASPSQSCLTDARFSVGDVEVFTQSPRSDLSPRPVG